VGGVGRNVAVPDPARLSSTVVVDTRAGSGGAPANGNVSFASTVDSATAVPRSLTVRVGTGTATFGGAIGATNALDALDVTANGVALPATRAASLTLTSTGGNITQTGAATIAGATAITGGAGAITMMNPGNDFNAVTVASGASASLFDSNAVSVGPVTVNGNVLIQTAAGPGNDVTLTGGIASAAGNVTVASGEDIHYGASTLAAAGRWLTYSRSPALDTGTIPNPGNAKPNLYNSTFGALGPGVVLPAAGNHHVYSYQPVLEYTATPVNRPYGDPNPAVSGTIVGLVNGDTAADAYSGTATWTTTALLASPAGAYPITGAGLASDIGYGFAQAVGNATAFTVAPAALTITANDASRQQGQPNPPFTAAYSGFKLGQTPAVLGGALAFSTPATVASAPGPYAITPLGQTATNYTITYVDGVLTVTPVPVVPVVPVPPIVSGVAAADNALITATQRSADAEGEVAPRRPDEKGVDCLELERAGQRRVLNRCY
jgi:hypothetical protein